MEKIHAIAPEPTVVRVVQNASQEPVYDGWLDRWHHEMPKGLPVLDLGCGQGADTMHLLAQGFRVVACDISHENLACVRGRCPLVEIHRVDIANPLRFASESFGSIVADLSLHYFDAETTHGILEELKRILVPQGVLLARVNAVPESAADLAGNAWTKIEEGYYDIEGHQKRYFDSRSVERFFCGWQRISAVEGTTEKYGPLKYLWEIILRK